jgi:superfamily I DNA/RNA helicase
MQLTAFQREVITNRARNLQILACAGSGKTEVLAPANIVAFTFTKQGCRRTPASHRCSA